MAAQPFWIRGHDGTRFRRNVPDLLLQHRNGAFTVVDVKPERMTKKPKVIDVLKWTDRVCRESGWHYEVWSGTNPTELSNVRFLSLAKRSRFVDRGSQLRVTDIDVTVTIAFDALCQQVDDSVRISPSLRTTTIALHWCVRCATQARSCPRDQRWSPRTRPTLVGF